MFHLKRPKDMVLRLMHLLGIIIYIHNCWKILKDPLGKLQIFVSCLEFLWNFFLHFAKPVYIALLVLFMQFYENFVLWY